MNTPSDDFLNRCAGLNSQSIAVVESNQFYNQQLNDRQTAGTDMTLYGKTMFATGYRGDVRMTDTGNTSKMFPHQLRRC